MLTTDPSIWVMLEARIVASRIQGFCLATQFAAGGIDRIAASSQGAAFGLITHGLRADTRRATHSGAPSYWWLMMPPLMTDYGMSAYPRPISDADVRYVGTCGSSLFQ